MKKMIMGIVAMMMAFGTMTMNANNAVKNDKNNHGKNVVVVNNHGHNMGHNDKGHHDAWNHNHNGMYNMNHGVKKGHVYTNHAWFKNIHMNAMGHNYINVYHCMHGFKVKTHAHHHVYAKELVNGHYTGHMICVHCAKHLH